MISQGSGGWKCALRGQPGQRGCVCATLRVTGCCRHAPGHRLLNVRPPRLHFAEKAKGLSGASLVRALPSGPHGLPKTPAPPTITLGLRFAAHGFWGAAQTSILKRLEKLDACVLCPSLQICATFLQSPVAFRSGSCWHQN